VGKSVRLKRPGKKQISGFGLPPIAVTTIELKILTSDVPKNEKCSYRDL